MPGLTFPCTGCGLCCIRPSIRVAQLKAWAAAGHHVPRGTLEFPYSEDPQTGRCENLTEDNQCRVYKTRPVICNVKRFADVMNLSRIAVYRSNAIECNRMMDATGTDPALRIDLKLLPWGRGV